MKLRIKFSRNFLFPFFFSFTVLESRACNKVDDKSRTNLDWLIVVKAEVAGCAQLLRQYDRGNASKVAEARKLRSRHFPVSAREGRGRRTVDQIHRRPTFA